MGRIADETIRGAKWGLIQKCTMQPVQFLYGIVLARLITPEEFGILGLTAIFFAVANTLKEAGFGSALIRKQDRTEEDCSTMFWFNWGMSCLMGLILFLLAPWFASFYQQPELLWLTRISALMMCISCTGGVHWVLYSARRDFKTPAIIGMISTLVGIPICLTLAYLGWGIWAIVTQNVVSSLLSLTIVWCVSPWRPKFLWSNSSFKSLFGFGSKLALSGLLHTFYQESRTFIIGKFYSPADLGHYSRGSHMAAMVPNTIDGMIMSVTYPILATLQGDLNRLGIVYRKYIKVITLPIVWGLFTLIALARPLVEFLYGSQWLPCVIYVQLVALACSGTHICNINLNLLQVLGRSDLFLRLEVIKKSISIAMLIYAATISVEAICWAAVIYDQIAIFINTYYTGKLVGLTWARQQRDYLPYYGMAVISAMPGYLLDQTPLPNWSILILGGASSILIYAFLLSVRRDEALGEYLFHIYARFQWRGIKRWMCYLQPKT